MAMIPQLTIPALKTFMRTFAVERRKAVLVEGPPGVGKSEMMNQLAKEDDAYLIDLRLNLYDSVDFRGIPSLEQVGRSKQNLTVWNIPATVPYEGNPRFPKDRKIYLFLDELGSANAAVFPVAMQLINEFAVGENKLMSNVHIFAATNRVSDRGTSVLLPTTVNNRFLHVEAVPDYAIWCDWWMFEMGGTPMARAYYEWRKDQFFTFDPKNKDLKAFATPRTNKAAWEFFQDATLPSDLKRQGMMAAIGETALDILSFAEVWSQVLKPRDILADPEGVPLPREESFLYATAVSVSGSMDLKTVAQFDKFLLRLPAMYQTLAWTLALRRTDGKPGDLACTPSALGYMKRNQQVF